MNLLAHQRSLVDPTTRDFGTVDPLVAAATGVGDGEVSDVAVRQSAGVQVGTSVHTLARDGTPVEKMNGSGHTFIIPTVIILST